MNESEVRKLPFGTKINISWKSQFANYKDENYNGVIIKDKIYYEDGKWDSINDLYQFNYDKFEIKLV